MATALEMALDRRPGALIMCSPGVRGRLPPAWLVQPEVLPRDELVVWTLTFSWSDARGELVLWRVRGLCMPGWVQSLTDGAPARLAKLGPEIEESLAGTDLMALGNDQQFASRMLKAGLVDLLRSPQATRLHGIGFENGLCVLWCRPRDYRRMLAVAEELARLPRE